MNDTLKMIGSTTVVVIVLSLVAYGSWNLKRHWNYKWGYESMVQAEVQKQIKPLAERISRLEAAQSNKIYDVKN